MRIGSRWTIRRLDDGDPFVWQVDFEAVGPVVEKYAQRGSGPGGVRPCRPDSRYLAGDGSVLMPYWFPSWQMYSMTSSPIVVVALIVTSKGLE